MFIDVCCVTSIVLGSRNTEIIFREFRIQWGMYVSKLTMPLLWKGQVQHTAEGEEESAGYLEEAHQFGISREERKPSKEGGWGGKCRLPSTSMQSLRWESTQPETWGNRAIGGMQSVLVWLGLEHEKEWVRKKLEESDRWQLLHHLSCHAKDFRSSLESIRWWRISGKRATQFVCKTGRSLKASSISTAICLGFCSL